MTLLKVENFSVSSRELIIVKNLTFEVRKGEWLGIVGQSGSGKSMTATAIGRLLNPNLSAEGKVMYGGENLLGMKSKEFRKIRGKQLSFIFQDYQGSFTPFLTIGQHFDEFLKTHSKETKQKRREMSITMLESVGLKAEIWGRYPFQLSGGQLQRVSIAIALILKPDLLIADEPTSALDSISSFQILQLLSDLQKETGCAILFITHDLGHVRKHADRILVMKEGSVIEMGEKDQLIQKPGHPYTKELILASPTLRLSPTAIPQEMIN